MKGEERRVSKKKGSERGHMHTHTHTPTDKRVYNQIDGRMDNERRRKRKKGEGEEETPKRNKRKKKKKKTERSETTTVVNLLDYFMLYNCPILLRV